MPLRCRRRVTIVSSNAQTDPSLNMKALDTRGLERHVTILAALAMNAPMRHAAAVMNVVDVQHAELFAAESVIQQHGKYCSITRAVSVAGPSVSSGARARWSLSAGVLPLLPSTFGRLAPPAFAEGRLSLRAW